MAYTDREDLNYLGILYGIGKSQNPNGVYTPFLSAIGGLQGGRAKTTSNFTFPLGQTYALAAASQDTQSEATAAAAGTPTTTTRSQDSNVCQIMKDDRSVSYAKNSAIGEISGVTAQNGTNPVVDELGWQKGVGLMQLSINIEYSFLQGSYVASSLASTNQKTRGLGEAISTNSTNAGSAALSKDLIDSALVSMLGNTAPMGNMVIVGNAFQIKKLNDIYGYAPTSVTIGGVTLNTINTPFMQLGIMYCPQMPTNAVYLLNLAAISPIFCPHKVANMGSPQLISWTETAVTAAQAGGFWYTQVGIDYGPEEYHAQITSLATS